MKFSVRRQTTVLGMLFVVCGAAASLASSPVTFNRDIRPILSAHCISCHGPDATARHKGLRFDQRDVATQALHDGKIAIVPGQPGASEMIKRITSNDPDYRMPPADKHEKLSDHDIATLRQWIAEGAKYEKFWAFTAPTRPTLPAIRGVHDEQWVRNPIDRFVLAKLESQHLSPAPRADRATLIRRVYLDLIGLPPTPAEVDAFLKDKSPDAYDKLVDRLLANPHFGERMALPWLDAARYADTNGFSIDDHRDMWAWRDWVIDAYNRNMPYDQFVTQQLAGDLMPNATDKTRLATGFLRNSMSTHEGGTIPAEYRAIYIEDKIDTVATTFLGLTLRCCQCHDHKYDPFTQKDYYSLYAFFDTAHEPGHGVVNANTPPMISVDPPLTDSASLRDDLSRRIAALKQAKLHPPGLDDARRKWEGSEIAKLDASPTVAMASFPMPPQDGAGAITPQWIWPDKTGAITTARFSRTFDRPANVKAIQLWLTCDDEATVRINGHEVGRVKLWMNPITVDITKQMRAGANTIDVRARNNGGPAGLIAAIAMIGDDNNVQYVVTDSRWKVSPGDAKPTTDATVVAPLGAQPWGDVMKPQVDTQAALRVALHTPEPQRTDAQWDAIDEAYAKVNSLMHEHRITIDVEIGVLEQQLKTGKTTVMVMAEQGPRQTYVLNRGAYDQPDHDQPVSPRTPTSLPPMPAGAPHNRLGLAEWITAKNNPLTARVEVNHLWQMFFGTGLVATANDFGTQGEMPSDRPLLDWLACEFRDGDAKHGSGGASGGTSGGWDTKAIVRLIVTSATYQQSSDATADMVQRDPDNRLMARGPRVRLPAEFIRDNALSIAGLLNPQLGGPSVYPDQPGGLWRQISHFGYEHPFTAQSFYPSGRSGQYRRSLYTFWKRTAPPPALVTFDAPTRETCTITRSRTNTPLQALVLLNDPQYVEAARVLAAMTIHKGGAGVDDRIRFAFRRATLREPDAKELTILHRRYEQAAAKYANDPSAAEQLIDIGVSKPDASIDAKQLAAWTVVTQTIMNLDEVITKE